MLEKAQLLILPWSGPGEFAAGHLGPARPGSAQPRRMRRIIDPADGAWLGFAGWYGGGSWLPYFPPLTLRVCEFPDASLLMSLYRPWGFWRMWRVHDADERRLGTFYRFYLFDGMGYLFAYLHSDHGRFLTRAGVELAAWETLQDGAVRLSFSAVPESSPFARMILLGHVLSWVRP